MNKTRKKINQQACYNRIWSWSPVPCEKHGPRASVTTKISAFGLGFCLLSPSGHVFHTARETMIKSYNIYLQCLIISWWRHQMKIFSALLAFCVGNSPVPMSFPAQWPATRSFDVFFDLRLNNDWVNNRDLRRHPAHYGVIVMLSIT